MYPGDVLEARFTLERLAGTGGMGEVFAARDERSGEAVAVKVLRSADLSDRTRFEREAAALAELHHPGIVRYIAHGVTPEDEPYLVMEWLDGVDLGRRLEHGMLGVDESIALATRIADALSAAHRLGIVHRDLKPSNLFLPAGDVLRVKILDFGIAKLHGLSRVTETGIVMGTPGYMAPEQARNGATLDARADVFALGCVLFECLTGVQAFSGEHVITLLAKILFEEVPPPSQLRPDVPRSLDALVKAMLAKDPALRPADGAAVAEAFAAIDPRSSSAASDRRSDAAVEPAALTGGEQRLRSVVLIGPPRKLDPDTTLTAGTSPIASSQKDLAKVAEANGGRFEQLSDGSVVVTIEAPGVATDQAAQAARCALALRFPAGTRPMALSTCRGQLVGKLALGEAIDGAARRLAEAPLKADSTAPIAIDEVTAGLLDARFEVCESTGGLELHGERDLSEETRTLLGKATACVGRDVELGTLVSLFAQCVDESIAEAALVTAPAGLGKSRLAHELVRRIRQRGEPFELWVGRGDSLRAGSAFSVLGQALRVAIGIREAEPLAVRRDKLRARVALRVPADAAPRVTEFLGEIIGAEFPDAESAPLRTARQDAQLMGQQMLRAWEDFLRAECAAAPILLLLDDLQWGDRPTIRFIDTTLASLKHLPWMVIGLARPEVHELFPRLWAERNVQELRLGALTPRASERLLRQALGNRISPEKAARITALAEGHAFYLEEMIRAVAEGKDEALPETVMAMVEARIARLDPAARRLLRAGSVFGDALWSSGVGVLLGALEPAWVEQQLSALVEQEVLVRRPESRFPDAQELAFRHALLREGAYAMLTPGDRVLGHRLAAVWLEQSGERDSMVLAEHFERGGESARAGAYYLRAAEQAHRAGDTEAALERAKRCLSCGVSDAVKSALLALLCEIHAWRAEYAAAANYAEEVMRMSAPGSLPWARAALVIMGDTLSPDRVDAFMARIRILDNVDPDADVVAALAFFFMAAIFLLDSICRFDLSEIVLLRVHAIVEPVAERDPVARAWMHVTHAFREAWAHDDPRAGLESARIARASFRDAGHPRGALLAQVFLGMNLWLLGAIEEAAQELESTMSADEELGPVGSLRTLCLAGALANRGAFTEAEELAARLIEVGRARQSAGAEGRGRFALADILRKKGDVATAEQQVRTALDLLTVLPLDHLAATATLAAIELAQGRAAEALATSADALERYDASGAFGFRGALARLVHAEALLALGEHDKAKALLTTARAHLLTRADKIGDPTLRRSFLESIPEHARTLALAAQASA
jgi:tetratricopeptide (TPR) repeat protein